MAPVHIPSPSTIILGFSILGLSVWKLVDIAIWLFSHVSVAWN